ncbi:MAG TPA: division/cell wall cluster transcriptional repressor MraZ [Candidatus Scatovivens faecipullorum]|nr:division/cell wall cluster transcriptional repressor MraZ [Candidatus Scatovivens faecipullorum]
MLIGEYEHSLDAKGRLIMPAKLREDIGEKFIITKGLDGCLFAFSLEEWKNFEQKLRSLPISNKDARAFSRFFFAGAIDCEIDKQGRFLISSNLREFAELTKEVVIIGMDSRLEIWSKDKWQNTDDEISADEIAEKMEMLGI